MAQFEPKKLNIGEINDGNRFNNGDGIGAEAINAPIEAAYYAQEIADNLEYEYKDLKEIADNHEERIAQTEYDTKMLYAIASQKGLYAIAEVEQAYTSRVTADGQNIVDGQKTPVTMIKGSTVRCENLLAVPYASSSGTTSNGITWTYDEQGVITANGTSTGISQKYLIEKNSNFNKAGTYTISILGGSTSTYYLEIEAKDSATTKWLWGKPVGTAPVTFTLNEGEYFVVQVRVASGVALNNQKIYVMLNVGSTALPYQPYFTDLKHSKINSIVSTGRNLLDISKFVGGVLVDNGDGTYTISKNGNARWSGVWTLDTPILLENVFSNLELVEKTTTTDKLAIIATLTNGVQKFFGLAAGGGGRYGIMGEVKSFQIYLNATEPDGAYFKFKNPYITRKDNYYTPFVQETYQLPETLELPEFDSFNPQMGELIKQTEVLVLDGTEEWKSQGENDVVLNLYFSLQKQGSQSYIIPTYGRYDENAGQNNKSLQNVAKLNATGINLLFDVSAEKFKDINGWKKYLEEQYENGTPIKVAYKLDTPTVETIENAPKSYTAYNQGNETAVLENEEFGAIPTITNEYIVVL